MDSLTALLQIVHQQIADIHIILHKANTILHKADDILCDLQKRVAVLEEANGRRNNESSDKHAG